LLKRPYIVSIILPLLLLVFLAGCNQEAAINGEDSEPEIPVEVIKVERGYLENHVELSGEVNAESNVTAVPRVNGTISTIKVDVGDQVRKGDLLIVLENKDMDTHVSQAEASLAQARAVLTSTRDVSLPKRTEQLRSGVEQAGINYNMVKNTYERMEVLYQEELISQVEFENTEREYHLVSSQYQSAQEQLRMEEEGIAKELAALEAQVDLAETALAAARSQLEYTRITAPIDGTVTLINAQQGNETAPGTPLLNIVDFNSIYVEVKITERLLGTLENGLPVRIKIPTTDAVYDGTIKEISLSPLPGTKAYLMKASFDADELVRLGHHAQLEVITEKAGGVIIPRTALLKEEDTEYVYVMEEHKAQKRELKLGLKTDHDVEVKEGLSEGDSLIVKGQHLLHEDAKIILVGGDTN
jgi:HlyD family secretion protein